jgi:hypothetical protein
MQRSFLVLMLVLVSVYGFPVLADEPVCQENRPVDDVLQAFDNLTHHGEWLGFHNGAGAPPRAELFSENHIQGIARSPRPGTPYFFVTSSGVWNDSDGSDGNLMVIEMGSRDESGERLRSNRLLRSWQTSCTPPDGSDRVVLNIPFPNHAHPGGMEMIGDILVVPLEKGRKDTGFCDGGSNHGGGCDDNNDCPSYCVGMVCEGGSNDGAPCTSIADCDGGGDCVGEGTCEGGINEGQSCGDHSDCESRQGACISGLVCEGGTNDGDSCADGDDCDSGACVNGQICDGGAYDGYACESDTDCPASGGTCILEGLCDGGSNDGNTCDDKDDCPSFSGFCSALGTCVGGSYYGDPCEFDKDCEDEGACRGLPKTRIVFYDMSNPLEPVLLPCSLELDHGAGAVGLAKLDDGHFLMGLAWGFGEEVKFWRSNKTSFFDEGFRFEYHDTWYPPGPKACSNPWAICNNTYQSISFVTQAEDNRLFMLAGRNTNVLAPHVPGEDVITVYEITGVAPGEEIVLEQHRSERAFTFQNDSSFVDYWTLYPEICTTPVYGDIPYYPVELTNADLLAGGTTYVSPSGELMFYAVTHYNDGVVGAGGDRIVRVVELRHQNVVRDDSSTYQPTADPGGPYTVDEGSAIELNGEGSRAALAAPWAQLFEDADFQGQSVMFDYADRDKDNYEDFGRLDGEAALWPCLDVEAIAEVTNNGKALIMDEIIPMNLTIDDFTYKACFLFEVGDECWITPPIPEIKGHEVCVEVCVPYTNICWDECACLPALPGQSLDCTLTPAIPGVPGYEIPIPDPFGRGWTVVPDLLALVSQLQTVVDQIGNCGRILGQDFREPPAPPAILDVIDPATYDENGDAIPDAVQDLEGFVNLFPTFGSDVVSAIGEVVNYAEDLVEYIDELLTTIHGFNDRASSVRWYAPVGTDIVVYDKTDYRGAKLVLEGTGGVEEIFNLGFVELTNQDGSPGHDANDRIRSMRFEGLYSTPYLDSYAWSITSPAPPEPLALHDAATAIPTFDASVGDGPTKATVELVVVDSLGGSYSATTSVQVLNVAPTIDVIGPDQAVFEDDTLVLPPVQFSDPGVLDTHTATIDWGDGSAVEAGVVTQEAGGGQVNGNHVYGDNSTYTVTVTVTDDDGGSISGQFTVTVSNLDPTPTLDTTSATTFHGGLAFTGKIGVEQSHDASATDPGSDDLRFTWTAVHQVSGSQIDFGQTDYFNDGQGPDPLPSGPGTFPFNADDTATVTFADLGVYLLTVSAEDDDGGSAEASLSKLIAGNSDRPLVPARWRKEFAEQDNEATLLALLGYVNFASSFFSEQVAVESIEQAYEALKPADIDLADSNVGQIRGMTALWLLAAWLNTAAGARDLNAIQSDGTTLLETFYAAEDVLANPSAKKRDCLSVLRTMIDVCTGK